MRLHSLCTPLLVAAVDLAAQSAHWAQVATSGPPTPRQFPGMCFDSQRGVTVVFGGGNSTPLYGDTWEWDGNAWSLAASAGPGARAWSGMVYDSQRGVAVLFGGSSPTSYAESDTWEWDGTIWTQVASTGPLPRNSHAMAYDSQRGVAVLFGGISNNNYYPGDTWEWDGTTWTQVANTGPVPRTNHAMAYDSQRGVTVLFGGAGGPGSSYNELGDTWEWDGVTWTQVSTSGPAPRYFHAMVYDNHQGRVVLFAGGDYATTFADTWLWDGTDWILSSSTGPGRERHRLAYDSQRDRTVLFGGLCQCPETWQLDWTGASFDAYGAGCPGSTTVQLSALNPAGGTLIGTVASLEYGIVASTSGASQIASVDLFTRSTGGTEVVPVRVYQGPGAATAPLGTTTMTVGPAAGFYTATFSPPVSISGNSALIGLDATAQNVVAPLLASGSPTVVYSRASTTGGWGAPSVQRPVYRVYARVTPALDHTGLPTLGATYDVHLADALPSTFAVLVSGHSDTQFAGGSLPAPLPGAPGCELFASPEVLWLFQTDAAGAASASIAVPSTASLVGTRLFHQWAVLDAANPLGIVVSNAGHAWVGN